MNGEPVRDAAYWRECWGAAVAKYAACEGEKLALEQENTKREALLWEGVSREQALRARILELEELEAEGLNDGQCACRWRVGSAGALGEQITECAYHIAIHARVGELEAERQGFIKAAAEATVRAIQAEERIGELEARIAELEPMATGEYFKQGVSRMQLEVERAKVALADLGAQVNIRQGLYDDAEADNARLLEERDDWKRRAETWCELAIGGQNPTVLMDPDDCAKTRHGTVRCDRCGQEWDAAR